MGSSDYVTDAPRTAIVTVSYRSKDALDGLLPSITQCDSPRPLVVIVDNSPGPSGGVQELAKQHGALYLPQQSNRGYGSAVNVAVAALPSTVEWVLVTNPDVRLQPGCVGILRNAMEDDPAIGAAGPMIMTDDQVYPSARTIPSLRSGIGHALFANLWIDNPWSRAYRNDYARSSHRRDAGWLSGSCFLVRRALFDELGGFDEGYFMYFEDVDLGYRIGKAGYRNVYEPSAVVTHTGAHSTGENSKLMIIAHHESARRFLFKKYAGWYLWPVRATLAIGLRSRSRLAGRRLAN